MDGHGGPEYLLGQSERLLRQRDFSGCRRYAIQALQSDPHLAGADQILAVANVLLASQTTTPVCNPDDKRNPNPNPNYYSVLQLPSRTGDSKLIREHFKKLILLVHPIKHEYGSAGEAFSLVGRAWSVLSNPKRKARFDSELSECYLNRHRHHYQEEEEEEEEGGGENVTFWTACPYCYCVYQYERVYVDCCLRCRNCRRPFHGVVIPPPPPLLVVPGGKDEYYCCLGVFPLGFMWKGENGVGGKTCASREGSEGSVGGRDDPPPLYSSGDGEDSSGKKADAIWENVRRKELEEGAKNCFEEKSDEREETERGEGLNLAEKRPMKRRKTVAKNAKKIMGTGNRVRKYGGRMAAGAGEGRLHLNVEAGNGGEGCDIGSIREMGRGSGEGFVIDGVKYFEGDDDIFVGLEILDDGDI